MKDFVGKPLELGDFVASNRYGYTDELELFQIVGFTEKKVEVNILSSGYRVEFVLKFPRQLAKVNL